MYLCIYIYKYIRVHMWEGVAISTMGTGSKIRLGSVQLCSVRIYMYLHKYMNIYIYTYIFDILAKSRLGAFAAGKSPDQGGSVVLILAVFL